jgi:hypothetical protein
LLSKASYIGLVILMIGIAVGVVGALSPMSSFKQQPVTLINTPVSVDPNDYATQSLQMTQGQNLQIKVSISNQTDFFFYVMNQTQYYVWYGCAPQCHQPLLGGQGTFSEQANETTPDFVNATVTPAAPYNGTFTAPVNGTFYFVFDNSVGPSWGTYTNHNATGNAVANFLLSSVQPVKSYSVNWLLVGAGSAAMLLGGTVSTAFWIREKKN